MASKKVNPKKIKRAHKPKRRRVNSLQYQFTLEHEREFNEL